MGAYSDRITAEQKRANKSDDQIRADKNQRTKERNRRRKDDRVMAEAERIAARAALSWQEKWAILDNRLGVNQGAARERERLAWESLNG